MMFGGVLGGGFGMHSGGGVLEMRVIYVGVIWGLLWKGDEGLICCVWLLWGRLQVEGGWVWGLGEGGLND